MRDWNEFALEWMRHVDESKGNGNNAFLQFMCYYMVFDRIISCYPRAGVVIKDYRTIKGLDKYERNIPRTDLRIAALLCAVWPQIQEGLNINSRNLEQLKKPLNEENGNSFISVENEIYAAACRGHFQGPKCRKAVDLFVKISKVRNHLFHGGKWPESPRDCGLVQESVPILRSFLDTLTTHFDNQFTYHEKKNLR